jgi:hypothetical protein
MEMTTETELKMAATKIVLIVNSASPRRNEERYRIQKAPHISLPQVELY